MQMGALALSHIRYPPRTPFVKAVLHRCGVFFALDDKFGPEWTSCRCARFLKSQVHAPAHDVCAVWLASVRGVRTHHEDVAAFHDAVYGFDFRHVHGLIMVPPSRWCSSRPMGTTPGNTCRHPRSGVTSTSGIQQVMISDMSASSFVTP